MLWVGGLAGEPLRWKVTAGGCVTKEAAAQGIGPSTLVRMWILEHVRKRRLRPSADSETGHP